MVARNKAIGESCLNLTCPLLGYIDTASAVRDMEALLIALDEGKMNFLGFSYGSQLGTQYAELFPDNFRVMALDGNLDHAQTETNMFTAEGATAQDVFGRFAAWCISNSTCALYGKNVTAVFDSLMEIAAANLIPAPGCVPAGSGCRPDVTAEDILFSLQPWLVYKHKPPTNTTSTYNWDALAEAIVGALNGDATPFSMPVYDSELSDDYAGIAIVCLDWFHTSADTLAKVKYKQQLASLIAPNTKGASQTYQLQVACVGWPVPLINPPHFMNIKNSAPILMINAIHDPEDSLVWAHALKEQIQNVVLLTRNGDGHTSYFLKGETTNAIDAYLINGTLPAPATVLDT
jgi:pimeloyl-ACP methyl ester carboxylesterase